MLRGLLRARGTSAARAWAAGTGGLVILLVVATASAVVALALLLGRQLEQNIHREALRSAERVGQVFASVTVQPDEFVNGHLTGEALDDLDRAVQSDGVVIAARVYGSPTRVTYDSKSRIARDVAATDAVRNAFAGETTARVTTLGSNQSRSAAPAKASGREVLEVNLPVAQRGRSGAAGVVTVYVPYGPTRRDIASQVQRTRLLVGGVALLLLLVAMPLTKRAVRSLAGGRRHVRLQRDLRRALTEGELVLHYQPKVDITTGAVVGTEALVRWEHPDRGLLPPGLFIPQCEETELMGPLTMHVFDLALAQIADWRRVGLELPPVAVNLSAVALADRDLASKLGALLRRHDVRAADVVIEMTETAMMSNPGQAQQVLAELDRMGFFLSIDDFGTGYSSLARLDQLPLTEVKIDRSFVSRITDEGTGRLVATMIDLSHDLGMRVVAEGVESEEVAQLLMDAGCRFAQGYHYARPMPATELASWLADRLAVASEHENVLPARSPGDRGTLAP